jgi:hypothetical protein
VAGKPFQVLLCGLICIPAVVSCAAKRPTPSLGPAFRMQPLQGGSVLLAPSVPETQATDVPLTLTVDWNNGVSSESNACKVSEGAFRIEPDPHTSKLHIVLPSPDAWISALENSSKSEGNDAMASFYSFLEDLDRSQRASCFAPNGIRYRDYILQSIPMRPSETLFNAYGYELGRGGVDLKPGLRLKVERAYFRPGEQSISNYLGVSRVSFDVQTTPEGTLQFHQAGAIEYSPESLEGADRMGVRDLSLTAIEGQEYYRLLFYTYVVPTENAVSAAIIGANDPGRLDELEQTMRLNPGGHCGGLNAERRDCFGFEGFVTVSVQIGVEINGQLQFVDWRTKVKGVVPTKAVKSLRIQRQFMNSLYDVRFNPRDASILQLTLVGGDRLSW